MKSNSEKAGWPTLSLLEQDPTLKLHPSLNTLTGSAKETSGGLGMQQGGAEAGAMHGRDSGSCLELQQLKMEALKNLFFTIPRPVLLTPHLLAGQAQPSHEARRVSLGLGSVCPQASGWSSSSWHGHCFQAASKAGRCVRQE